MKMTTRLLITIALLMLASPGLHAAEPAKEDAALSSKLITAIEASDFEAFLSDGDAAFKALPKAQFEAVSVQLAARLKNRDEVTYLGELTKQGFRVTLWRIKFKDGGDDALATLSVKDGKVGGFLIQ